MGRYARDRRPPDLKPVERVAVTEEHFGRRMVLFLLCLVIGVSGLSYGVYSLLSTDPGWVVVEVSSGETNCGGEFTFEYLLDQGGLAGSEVIRNVRAVYSDAAVKAYRLFTTAESFEDLHNLRYINEHPNQDIVVDPVLYQAFETVQKQESRAVYQGILNSFYQDLFFCQEDWETFDFDPIQNPEAAELYRELASFAADPAHAQVQLLGENTLRLNLSEEYRQYAGELGRDCYLDFGWLRNAFAADFLAETLLDQGYTTGVLTSYDGYTRSLGGAVGNYGYNLFDWYEGRAVKAVRILFDEPMSLVNFRTFPLQEEDEGRTYVMANGELRHGYLDASDGICRAAMNAMLVYSQESGCAEIALKAAPVFIADDLDQQGLRILQQDGMEIVAATDGVILHSQKDLALDELYTGETGGAYREESWEN